MKNNQLKVSPYLLPLLITLCSLCFPGKSWGQVAQAVTKTPDCQFFFKFSTSGITGVFDNRTVGCDVWRVGYQASSVGGTVSAVSLVFQSAPGATVAGTFVTYAGAVVTGANPQTSTSGSVATFTGGAVSTPWVRLNLGTLTSTGTATLSGVVYGWKTQGDAVVTSGGGGGGCSDPCTVIQPSAAALNATVVQPTAANLNTTAAQPTASLLNATVVQSTAANLNATVVGTVATGVAVSGNPVRVGGKDQNGITRDLGLTDTGMLPTNSFSLAGADGIPNTTLSTASQNNSQVYNRVFPYNFNGSTNDRQFSCTNSAPIAVSASGNTQIIALGASQTIRICHISWSVSDGSAPAIKITTGTGTNCASGTADVSGVYTSPGVALDPGNQGAFRSAVSSEICLNLGTAIAVGGIVSYARF